MRALFLKELKQGQPLLVFAAAMGLLVIVAYAAVGRFMLIYGQLEQPVLAFAFGIVAAVMLPLLALFASSGILAGEAHADTLPVLFGLPISRLRIWGAMALAALSLLVLGSVIVLTITRTVLHSPFLSLSLRAHLPDAVCFALFILSVGLFCSSLARGVTAALASTVLLTGAIAGGAAALVFYYGAPITGLFILDLALWCLFASPALLLGSARAVTRGELLTGYRKWLFSIPVTLLALALTVVLVCALARATTRYHRESVAVVSTSGPWGGTKLLPLLTNGGGTTFSFARGELLGEPIPYAPTLGTMLEQLRGSFPSFTRNYGVALDLETGKELFTVRAPLVGPSQPELFMGCSADGHWVATLGPQQGMTWGRLEGEQRELCIYDTETDKLIARNTDLFDWQSGNAELSWSPSGEYLAIMRSGGSDDKKTLRVVGRNAVPLGRAPIVLRAATWSPVEDMLYGLDANGALCQMSPEGKKTKLIWSPPPGTEKTNRWFGPDAISPDGRWAMLNESADIPFTPGQRPSRGRVEQAVRLVDIATGDAKVLWRNVTDDMFERGSAWSSDGRSLYVLTGRRDSRTFWPTYTRRHQLMRWRQGEEGLTPLGPEITATRVNLLIPPRSDEVLLWTWQEALQKPGEYGPSRVVSEELLAIAEDGRARRLPIVETPGRPGWMGSDLGFDSRGRLIYLTGQPGPGWTAPAPMFAKVAALDLKTGKTETVYP